VRAEEQKDYKMIKEKADKVFSMFYNGLQLNPFEKDLQRRYVSLKVAKFIKF